ncbi:hypothetical protein FKP32DRAFT_1678168 [Trametes sanguinea]|nr:hypothetical protein FKP32DRAFT_1678168 [Trametes sanguinea]
MPRGVALQPLELAPEWLTEGPITADDLRCISPASTLFRMSFGATSHLRHRASTSSISTAADDGESDTSSFLCYGEDSDDDDTDTVEDTQPTAAPLPASSIPPASEPSSRSATPPVASSHSRTPSAESAGPAPTRFDTRSPWFMQIDPGCLAALDDQLLQYPFDAFADLCYSRAVRSNDSSSARATPVPGGYSWRRLSRLLSACPDLSNAALDFAADTGSATAPTATTAHGEPADARESESESDDTDSEQLASPEQPAPMQGWACSVYQPSVERQHADSPYRPYVSARLPLLTPLRLRPWSVLDALELAAARPNGRGAS